MAENDDFELDLTGEENPQEATQGSEPVATSDAGEPVATTETGDGDQIGEGDEILVDQVFNAEAHLVESKRILEIVAAFKATGADATPEAFYDFWVKNYFAPYELMYTNDVTFQVFVSAMYIATGIAYQYPADFEDEDRQNLNVFTGETTATVDEDTYGAAMVVDQSLNEGDPVDEIYADLSDVYGADVLNRVIWSLTCEDVAGTLWFPMALGEPTVPPAIDLNGQYCNTQIAVLLKNFLSYCQDLSVEIEIPGLSELLIAPCVDEVMSENPAVKSSDFDEIMLVARSLKSLKPGDTMKISREFLNLQNAISFIK